VNARGVAHRVWSLSKGSNLYPYYESHLREYERGIPEDTTETALAAILSHAVSHVPYYRRFASLPIAKAPFEALRSFPLLDKDTIRAQGADLCSSDLGSRAWHVNASGGSTGVPVRLIQDAEYGDRTRATTTLYWHLLGHDFGEREVWLWGSERDILQGGPGLGPRLKRFVNNQVFFNAFQMTETTMREALATLDRRPPDVVMAYAQVAYELARFAERNSIGVRRQNAIVSRANTLFPFMREVIERVFGCPVYNHYGSREVSGIATELPGYEGLWIAPWNCHLEILDSQGDATEDGVEGELVVTCLSNFAMPLIRYRIGDTGLLMPKGVGPHPQASRMLASVTGRTVDLFRLKDGTLVSGGYLAMLLYFRDWIRAFQIVQKTEGWIVYRFVLEGGGVPRADWDEICSGVRRLFGTDCQVDMEIVDEIPALPSGKYRYTISELVDPPS
jgi:phenylacetate-CoA ligase